MTCGRLYLELQVALVVLHVGELLVHFLQRRHARHLLQAQKGVLHALQTLVRLLGGPTHTMMS